MTDDYTCPFGHNCDDCRLFLENDEMKYQGCVFNVISRNLMEINVSLKKMLGKSSRGQ